MVNNVILMNGSIEICGLRKRLEAAFGLKSRASKRYLSAKL